MCIVDGHHNQHQSTPNQPLSSLSSLPQKSEFSDSAWPLYSIYSNIAEEEIDKMVERCQRDADGTLIFVRSHVSPQMTPHINWET